MKISLSKKIGAFLTAGLVVAIPTACSNGNSGKEVPITNPSIKK